MLKIENIEDLDLFASPTLTRKASDNLNQTNLTMGSIEYCSTIQLHETFKECRICLDQIEDSNHIFVSPCRCSGSLKFVHHSCFLHWLERQYLSRSHLEQRLLQEEGIDCELCKQRIYLCMENEYKCLKDREMMARVKTNTAAFIVLVVFAAVIGASLGLVIYFMQSGSSSFGKDVMATSVLACALVFLFVTCGFTFFYLITKYCMEVKSNLISFSHHKTGVRRSKNRKQVIPRRYWLVIDNILSFDVSSIFSECLQDADCLLFRFCYYGMDG